MKNIVLSFLFFIPLLGISQNFNNLDEKYGFNKFKLETSFQTYNKDLEFIYTDKKTGSKHYKYIKKDISVFGYNDIEHIGLVFYKNKLYQVYLKVNLNQKDDDETYKTILTKLKNLFGNPTLVSSGSDYKEGDLRSLMENVIKWESNKTSLGLNRVNCNLPDRPCWLSIFVQSNVLQRQIDSDGF